MIIIKPISEYIKIKKEVWQLGKSSDISWIKKFAQSIGIILDFNYEDLNKLLINEDIANFIEFYKINQFTLSVSQRKDIQKKIKDKCDLPIITKNKLKLNIIL